MSKPMMGSGKGVAPSYVAPKPMVTSPTSVSVAAAQRDGADDQPRDELGRFGEGSGGGEKSAAGVKEKSAPKAGPKVSKSAAKLAERQAKVQEGREKMGITGATHEERMKQYAEKTAALKAQSAETKALTKEVKALTKEVSASSKSAEQKAVERSIDKVAKEFGWKKVN